MGTTKMSPEPRTSNGKTSEVKTDPDECTVLTEEQKAELKKARETNGKKPAPKKPAPATKGTNKAPRERSGVRKAELGSALKPVQDAKKAAVQAVDNDDLKGCVAALKDAITAAEKAITLAETMRS